MRRSFRRSEENPITAPFKSVNSIFDLRNLFVAMLLNGALDFKHCDSAICVYCFLGDWKLFICDESHYRVTWDKIKLFALVVSSALQYSENQSNFWFYLVFLSKAWALFFFVVLFLRNGLVDMEWLEFCHLFIFFTVFEIALSLGYNRL